MVATFFQLNHGPTTVASLPASFFSSIEQLVSFLVVGTLLGAMPFSITQTAHSRSTPRTFPNFTAVPLVNMRRLDPFSALPCRTIYAVLGRVFLEFLIPRLLKLDVKQLINMFERNMICCAAFGWHMLGIRDGHAENSLQAGMAHTMSTF